MLKAKSVKAFLIPAMGSILLMAAVILVGPAGKVIPAWSDMFIYPKKGQSEEQQRLDRYECHIWAVQQTGFDPTAPVETTTQSQSSGGEVVSGAAKGAALGAIGGAITGDAGKGAAAGAAMGGAAGGMKRRGNQRQQQEAEQQQQAAQQQQQSQYDRALATCLEARDYTVN